MSTTTVLKPAVGCPATIHLFSDSQAAVVVKVNAKSIVVQRVEVDEASKRQTNPGEPFPCWVWNGDTGKPVGEPERYKLVRVLDDGMPQYANGSIRLGLGYSHTKRDYRF